MSEESENGKPDKPSPVEVAKAASNYLRGTIAEVTITGHDGKGLLAA